MPQFFIIKILDMTADGGNHFPRRGSRQSYTKGIFPDPQPSFDSQY
jgi:hypothetical protein